MCLFSQGTWDMLEPIRLYSDSRWGALWTGYQPFSRIFCAPQSFFKVIGPFGQVSIWLVQGSLLWTFTFFHFQCMWYMRNLWAVRQCAELYSVESRWLWSHQDGKTWWQKSTRGPIRYCKISFEKLQRLCWVRVELENSQNILVAIVTFVMSTLVKSI